MLPAGLRHDEGAIPRLSPRVCRERRAASGYGGRDVGVLGGGAFSKEVKRISFLDGNSNQGDALCYEPVGRAPRHCWSG
jgi:hypothetical protein